MISQSKRGVTFRLTAALLIISWLAACSKPSPVDVEEYTTRLARVLEQPGTEIQKVRMPSFPRKRDLALHFSEESIDLLEFLGMGDCRLQSLVAERNSSLGRLAHPSRQLVYEIRFLQAGRDCIDVLDDDDLAGRLALVLAGKREELGRRIFNATLGGDEFRRLWSVDEQPVVPDAKLVHVLRSLNSDVSRWLAGDYQVDESRLESSLERIRNGGGGNLLNAWWHLRSDLDNATGLLDARRAERPLCYDDMKTKDAEIFDRVVRRFFVGGVQKEVGIISSVSFSLLEQVRILENALTEAEPEAYRQWRLQRESIVADGRQSIRDHVAALAPLLEQCGLLPGEAPWHQC